MYKPDGADGKHRKIWYRYLAKPCPDVHRPLLTPQVNGFVHMVIRTCGEFPLNKVQFENCEKYDKILERFEGYRGPITGGGFLKDSPGMGKTTTSLAYFD